MQQYQIELAPILHKAAVQALWTAALIFSTGKCGWPYKPRCPNIIPFQKNSRKYSQYRSIT